MSDFFLYTVWTPERTERAYESLDRTRHALIDAVREVERVDPIARRFDVGDCGN